jgi:very-short-patch-repair endonuclease
MPAPIMAQPGRMSVVGVTSRLGNVAERRQLIAGGNSPKAIASAVRAGSIERVRRAWYATSAATLEQRVAVRIGGRLGGPSALPGHGIWRPPGTAVHVSLAPNASRLRPPAAHVPVVLHWTDPARPNIDLPAWRVDAVTAVSQTLAVVAADAGTAVLDSALFTGAIDVATAARICAASPHTRHLMENVDGRAESGIESLVRVRLAGAGVTARPQVVIPNLGRVDLLIGDRLVVEVDGREFHGPERFESDRRRDLELAALGLRSLRVSYRQVIHDWYSTEDAILRLLDAGEHRTPPGSFFRIEDRPRRNSPVARGAPPLTS